MKITHPHIAYSDIPRLVQEGVIKIGTRVKACDDQEKYPNGFTRSMQKGVICEIAEISDEWFRIQYEGIISMSVPYSQYMDFFLDILSDEEEGTCKDSLQVPKSLSFDEPLTKEAVGRVIVNEKIGENNKIINVSVDGNWVQVYFKSRYGDNGWLEREILWFNGWDFAPSEPTEITIEEAEKLTGKKIKR
jgi:hypothetical protein